VVAVIVLLWLLIGTLAAFQRGYFQGAEATCAQTSTSWSRCSPGR
jgi:hypothetical protein